MKKRWITILLTLVATLCLCLGMAACADKNPPETETWTIEQVYARAQELGFEGTLEELIAQFKGDDGKDGKDGIGIEEMYINTDGELIVVLTEGDPVNLGTVRGKDGKDGVTPHIGDNGNWWIGEQDTGVKAQGTGGGGEGKSIFDVWKETYGDENSTEEDFFEWLRGSGTAEDGLQYTLNPDNRSYAVAGIGTYDKLDLVIPTKHAGMPVTEIAENVFRDNQWIRSVTIPNTIKKIGMNAFENCFGLTKVIISDLAAWCNIDFERDTGFWGGDAYNPANPLTYANHLFLNDTELKELDISADVTRIMPGAFCGGTGITSIKISDSVTSIGEAAFFRCSAEITWGEHPTVKEIEEKAFYGYRGVSFTIPDSVTSIGEEAFRECSRLTRITIPASVTSLGGAAFAYCSGLESITVAGGNPNYHSDGNCLIETASQSLVLGCKNSVIPKDGSVTEIGDHAFYGCDGLTGELKIPDSVTEIGSSAFSGCGGLTGELKIPDSVTEIGDRAFYNCSGLESVTIGSGVTSIGYAAFQSCDSLTSVTFANTSGWVVTRAFNMHEQFSISVDDAETAASYLRTTYCDYDWKRS